MESSKPKENIIRSGAKIIYKKIEEAADLAEKNALILGPSLDPLKDIKDESSLVQNAVQKYWGKDLRPEIRKVDLTLQIIESLERAHSFSSYQEAIDNEPDIKSFIVSSKEKAAREYAEVMNAPQPDIKAVCKKLAAQSSSFLWGLTECLDITVPDDFADFSPPEFVPIDKTHLQKKIDLVAKLADESGRNVQESHQLLDELRVVREHTRSLKEDLDQNATQLKRILDDIAEKPKGIFDDDISLEDVEALVQELDDSNNQIIDQMRIMSKLNLELQPMKILFNEEKENQIIFEKNSLNPPLFKAYRSRPISAETLILAPSVVTLTWQGESKIPERTLESFKLQQKSVRGKCFDTKEENSLKKRITKQKMQEMKEGLNLSKNCPSKKLLMNFQTLNRPI